ncbi:MAG: TrkH family potassium uptake protein [Firmicutes bacterium]|nr:TrkH family potassium uptake protein [Bacillota bacterium]MTI70700.1 TrkH family potassium uptake protein [Bacillota bacterium]
MTVLKRFSAMFYVLSSLLLLLGIILFLPLSFSFIYDEGPTLYKAYIIPSIISIFIGIILNLLIDKSYLKLDLAKSMILCTLGWVIVSLIGSIPFQIALDKSFIDSFFESVSGFTTTGITVFENLNNMPKSILFWRSLIQWLGGLGILTFFLFVTFRNEGDVWQVFTAESHKINMSRPVPNIYKTIKILWSIYIFLTLLELFILFSLDVSLFDSIIHSLTTLSTGGFSNYDQSIANFKLMGHSNYRIIEYVFIIFMFLGGINFFIHYKILTGNIKEFFKNTETKYYYRIILLVTIIILFSKAYISDISSIEENIRTTLFQVISVMTTTGYGTEYIGSNFFPTIAKELFLILMLIGGCVGSTAGGVKVVRIVTLYKLFIRELKKIFLPKNTVLPITLDKTIIEDNEVFKIAALFFAWLLLILVGSGITSVFSDLGALESLSGMLSAVGNIGPFYFSVEKMASLSPVIKITYIFGMLAGRLEILPIFIIFSRKAWK